MALCACISQMQLESPARQSNPFPTCTGNMGTHVKKIGRQFLVSGEGDCCTLLNSTTAAVLGQRPCFSCLMWEAEEGCSAWDRTEWRIFLTPYGEMQLTTGRNRQYVKTYKKIVFMKKQTSSSTWHLIVMQILTTQMLITTCMYVM